MTTTSRPLAKVKFTTCGAEEEEDVIAVQFELASPARPAAKRRDRDDPTTYKPPYGCLLGGARSRRRHQRTLATLASSASLISSSTFGSSIVAGVTQGSRSAIFFIVPRRILPERVFGRRDTTKAILKAATGPILSRTSWTTSVSISCWGRLTPAFRTTNPQGVSPLTSSLTPSTAHSATSGCEATTSSIPPVDRRCPATLMMSSVRPRMVR